jgi:hypothetical protein
MQGSSHPRLWRSGRSAALHSEFLTAQRPNHHANEAPSHLSIDDHPKHRRSSPESPKACASSSSGPGSAVAVVAFEGQSWRAGMPLHSGKSVMGGHRAWILDSLPASLDDIGALSAVVGWLSERLRTGWGQYQI